MVELGTSPVSIKLNTNTSFIRKRELVYNKSFAFFIGIKQYLATLICINCKICKYIIVISWMICIKSLFCVRHGTEHLT